MNVRASIGALLLGALLMRDAIMPCAEAQELFRPADSSLSGPLISSKTGMETAWDLPKNPLTDPLPPDTSLARRIISGYRIFTDTPRKARRLTGNSLSCNNCHLNAGQREKAMPLVGVAGVFPEYSKRAGRQLSLEDRIVGCFVRSEDAPRLPRSGERVASMGDNAIVSDTAAEVRALASYITWVSEGFQSGSKLPWRGQNTIPQDQQVPVKDLDTRKGRTLFRAKCTACHGVDGQGVRIGDKKAGPLWGPQSWNDGAGAARVYTLAGMILYMMPYLDIGSLTAEEAQSIAAYIDSKPRPRFPHKERDYAAAKVPPDAVYYRSARSAPDTAGRR